MRHTVYLSFLQFIRIRLTGQLDRRIKVKLFSKTVRLVPYLQSYVIDIAVDMNLFVATVRIVFTVARCNLVCPLDAYCLKSLWCLKFSLGTIYLRHSTVKRFFLCFHRFHIPFSSSISFLDYCPQALTWFQSSRIPFLCPLFFLSSVSLCPKLPRS